jgi:hypothetical protein
VGYAVAGAIANELACPVMGTGAGLHGDQAAYWKLSAPSDELVARQGSVDDQLAAGIDGMNLDDVFCQIGANSCNLAHGTSGPRAKSRARPLNSDVEAVKNLFKTQFP